MTAVAAACAVVGLIVGAGLEVVVDRVPQRASISGWTTRDLNATRAAAVAALTAVLFVCLAVRYHDSWALPAFLALAAGLVALSVIDFEHFLLPNRIVYPLALATPALLTVAALGDDDWAALGRAVLGGALAMLALGLLHLLSPRSMGFGDVKLALLMGAALGKTVSVALMLGMVAAMVPGLYLLVRHGRAARKMGVPLGPFLALGSVVALFWGHQLLHAYFSTLHR